MFTLPEAGLTGLSDADLSALEAEGIAAFDALDLTEDSDADAIETGTQIAEAVRQVRAERDARAERRATVTSLREQMAPRKEPAAEADEADEEPAADEVAEESADQEEQPVAEAEQQEQAPETDAAEAEVVAEAEQIVEEAAQPEAVAASTETPAQRAARNATPPSIKEKRVNVLVAAADSGFPAGAHLDTLTQVAEGFQNRMSGLAPQGQATKSRASGRVAGINLDVPVHVRDFSGDGEVTALDQAMAEAVRLREPQSITAAAGWASPSETLYDLCQYEQATNLLNLAEVGVSRGGLRYTREPDFSTIFAGVGFDLTEAQVIADTSKGSYSVPTPNFVDVRLDAVGFVLRAGILQNAAYPELVRRVLEGALVAHQLKVNAKVIAAIQTTLGAALTPVDEGTFSSNLDALAFVAESIRQRYRLPDTHVVNVVLAKWVQVAYKADIARRTARPTAAVSDAELREWFTSRNLNPQFVWGLDELDLSGANQVIPKATTPALMYPEGTFVKLMSPVIDLSAIYDSTLLDTNVYSAAFVEQGVEVAHRCLGGSAVTLNVTASGRTGAADLNEKFGVVDALP